MWNAKPEYKTLFAGVNETDGGAIINSLKQMGVPYQYSEGGGSILVPVDKVYDTRLQLASQGLPKGSVIGFELFENQKMGVTQFQEQVNFQRGLEGELIRSIQSLDAVASARVHLALPKNNVFLREQQKPTASVVVVLKGACVALPFDADGRPLTAADAPAVADISRRLYSVKSSMALSRENAAKLVE